MDRFYRLSEERLNADGLSFNGCGLEVVGKSSLVHLVRSSRGVRRRFISACFDISLECNNRGFSLDAHHSILLRETS